MADVLVLGGTAWLGREVVRAALARDDDVTCLARGESGDVPDGARLVVADRTRPGAYDEVAGRGWDAVVDVARQPGQVRAALAALAGEVGHWTLVSTCSVYADATQVGGDEDDALLEPATGDELPVEQYGAAKVACEQAVVDALGDRALLARAGLIGGPGDPTDRFGYWVGRFALAGDEPVLVPEASTQPTQTIDVRDLAAWLAGAAAAGLSGPVDAVPPPTSLGTVLARAAEVAGHAGARVPASVPWLEERGVGPWSGERSLPLWLPDAMSGMCGRTGARALRLGLLARPLEDTLADTLAWEREQGLDRPRGAGLTRADELDLLGAL